MTKFAVITTTIRIPLLLKKYASNFRRYGWKDLFFVIAGDKKTPPEIESFCKDLEKTYNYPFYYLDLKDQKTLNKRLYHYIPFNSVARRNFAIFFAYKNQADVIITIDDDNYVLENNYLKYHSIVGSHVNLNLIKSSSEWFNVCESLKEKKDLIYFHRGFPINQRKFSKIKILRKNVKIIANAGLWLDGPDTDAIAWLNFNDLNVLKFDSKKFGVNFSLEKGTWCPFNSQNTAIAREAIPAYFLNPVQLRYDDIWASLVLRRIAEHFNHYISYGEPIVQQKRNVHNFIKDLKMEIDGMERTPTLVKELKEMEIEGNNYLQCAKFLIKNLSNEFNDLKKGYKLWIRCISN